MDYLLGLKNSPLVGFFWLGVVCFFLAIFCALFSSYFVKKLDDLENE